MRGRGEYTRRLFQLIFARGLTCPKCGSGNTSCPDDRTLVEWAALVLAGKFEEWWRENASATMARLYHQPTGLKATPFGLGGGK